VLKGAAENSKLNQSTLDVKNTLLGSDNLRVINDITKKKRRHQHSMQNKLDPLAIASNYDS